MKKISLLQDNNNNIKVIGLSTAQKAYRLCWYLNHHLQYSFKRIEDHEIVDNSGRTTYPLYKSANGLDEEVIYILQNSIQGNTALPRFKIADFLIVYDTFSADYASSIIENVKAIPFVQTVFSIDVNKIKPNHVLLFEQ